MPLLTDAAHTGPLRRVTKEKRHNTAQAGTKESHRKRSDGLMQGLYRASPAGRTLCREHGHDQRRLLIYPAVSAITPDVK